MITVIMVFFIIFSLAFLGLLASAIFGVYRNFKMDGEIVTREQFLRRGGPGIAILSSLLLAAAYALWKERAWGRHLASAIIVLPIVAAIATAITLGWKGVGSDSGRSLAISALDGAWWLWYFYAKPNVVSYYSQLGRSKR